MPENARYPHESGREQSRRVARDPVTGVVGGRSRVRWRSERPWAVQLARCWRPARAVLASRRGVCEVGEAGAVALDRAQVVVSAGALEGAHEEQLLAVG